ncbi:MAG: fused MFS/spermidine synthase [Bacteroidota bacterium]
MKSPRPFLYFLSFLEGGSVMVCELVGAKMLAPFFGTSLYVWASVLGLTLLGLTSGYFSGGVLSKKYANDERLLFWVLVTAGIFLALMPVTSRWIMEATIHLNLESGAIISLMVFMFPPLVFMGMASPIIINLLTQEVDSAGNSAGNVYAISTVGGILFTFLMGFHFIPEFGVSKPAVITGALLAVLPAAALVRQQQKIAGALMILLIGLGGWKISQAERYPANYKVLYESEGILGQVRVVDHPAFEITPDARMGRGLIVNNTLQTYVGLEHDLQHSIWPSSNYFPTTASIFPVGSKVLLLGLGGGTLVKQFNRLGYEVDVVEIDRRIWDISVKYFNMDPATNVIIDDARHYVRIAKKKYDIIVFDTFIGESVPEHLMTMEGFDDARRILNPGGMIMASFYGFINGENGKAARCVLKTFLEAGFKTNILATPGTEDARSLIFLASEEEKDFSTASYQENGFEKIDNLYDYFLDISHIDTSQVEVLVDAKPRLSKLYAKAAMQWKKSYNKYYQKYFFGKK